MSTIEDKVTTTCNKSYTPLETDTSGPTKDENQKSNSSDLKELREKLSKVEDKLQLIKHWAYNILGLAFAITSTVILWKCVVKIRRSLDNYHFIQQNDAENGIQMEIIN